MKITFGEYIRKLRNEKELTLTQLAALLGLDSANLSKIENGKRDFDEKRLIILSEIFNIREDVIRQEYIGDIIAKTLYENNCNEAIFTMVKEKVKYLEQKEVKI
ncbi:XRE family transcriptional regulator [Ancylomarina euxinus]|uniref:XRE family transcriptional regulator n=1 Tax=Ancylomarina euxinus TaxID=2283627 RepID=A0A425Y8J6_9BACT|nr:helix-turn-helix transcriptional regulator [Ancylomarina euxinus]MCZ4693310.1 helix-turn-helix transcriptional regulator [Ancylomarina euxinus]MUP13538.1 helix-turn-helix domain-containing protein [Ancylomarina euxinus]RRG24813.1 XRE family transcriptional regulator [Ancylomarina euxinus]